MIFCKHEWKLLDKTVIPSKMEILRSGYSKFSGDGNFPIDFHEMCKQKVVITFTCSKCGKLKIVTKSN